MKRLAAAFAIAALASPALSALPPDSQRVAELKAVIDAALDVMAGGGEVMNGVVYLEQDAYEVQFENCTLRVNIVGIAPDQSAPAVVGPRQFKAVPEQFDCTN